jgi:hypothetical protein
MIGLSWNVRGLGNPRAFAALSRLLKKHSPDFVFISESKLCGSKIGKCGVLLGYSNYFCVDSIDNSGGLLLLWKDSCGVVVLSSSSGHIDARVTLENGFCFRFSGVYGDPIASKRISSWELLCRLRLVDNLPWVCGGDFNEVLSVNDKVGGSGKSFSGMNKFRQAIDDCNLTDLGFCGPKYT